MTTANSMASRARDKNDTIKRDTMTKAIKIETKNMIRKLRSVENATLKQTFRYCWSLISIFFGFRALILLLAGWSCFFILAIGHTQTCWPVTGENIIMRIESGMFPIAYLFTRNEWGFKAIFQMPSRKCAHFSLSTQFNLRFIFPFSLAALSIQSMRCRHK